MSVELEEEQDVAEKMQEMLDSQEEVVEEVAEEPVEEVEEETADETEEPEEEPTEQPGSIAEGPSLAMKAAAEAQGLPPQLVAIARDDRQIQEMLDLAAGPSQEETPEEPSFELSLPEDEFGPDDPVRKELGRLQTHFSSQLDSLKQQLNDAKQKVGEVKQTHELTEKQQAAQQQFEFDTALDGLGVPAFGETKSLSDAHIKMRSAAYDLVQEWRAKEPQKPIGDLAARVAKELGLPTKTEKTADSVRQQAKKRLGGGPSNGAPSTKSDVERLQAYMDKLGIKPD